MLKLTNAHHHTAVDAHAAGVTVDNWPHAATPCPLGGAWSFGPSGWTYGQVRLTLKEFEQATAPAIVPEPRYAKTLPHGVMRFVARDELLDVDLWHAEGSSIYVTIAPSDILPLDPVDLIARGLQRLVDADQAQHIAKLIITGQLPGVKYEA